MTVKAILSEKGHDVVTAANDTKIADVVQLLATRKIGAAVILNEDEAVCGIVSERDIVRDIAREGNAALDLPVSHCMTSSVVSCTAHDTVNEVMEVMTKNRFRHLPVMENGVLQGIISIGDVVKRKIEQVEREAEDIKSYIAAV